MKHIFDPTKADSISAVATWMTRRSSGAVGVARRRRWTGAEKARLLALLAESGLSVMAFSRKSGVPFSTLWQWRRQADRWRNEATKSGFAKVRIAGSPPRTTASVHLPCGARLEAEVGTDPEWIGAIIKAAASA